MSGAAIRERIKQILSRLLGLGHSKRAPEPEQSGATRLAATIANDARQSPIGFFLLAESYLDAADALFVAMNTGEARLKLAFEHPVRHLYAHAWELALKACLARQGMKASEMKKKLGHRLTAAWDRVDKAHFAALDLNPRTRIVPEVLDQFHPTKFYAYPVTGLRREFSLSYLRAATQRFRLPRAEIQRLFE